ncbi:MAG: PKD domain-containing protein, partial [Bacteroidetes bacterium]
NVGCAVPFEVQFINQTTGALSYQWHFEGNSSANTTVTHPLVTYPNVDTLWVRLIAYGPNGCNRTRIKHQYIQIQPVESDFKGEPRRGCAPLEVAFSDSTTSPFPITSWQWDFGDGFSSTAPNPIHVYADTGHYDVTLITTNSRGCTDTLVRPGYIATGDRPVAAFAVDTNQACALTPVQFVNHSQGANAYVWYFGDGDTAMSVNPAHGFAALGLMDVMLVAAHNGCRDTVLGSDVVDVLAPLPIIGISDKRVCKLPQAVHFMDLSIQADTYQWLVDGTTLYNQPAFSHTFYDEGTHGVQLTVTNLTTGCTVTSSDSLVASTVKADFAVDTNRGCAPIRIRFTNESYHGERYWWHFGIGDTSTVTSPVYNYRHVGNYPVTLIAENELHCRDTLVWNAIEVLGVNAAFGVADSTNGCVPFPVQFHDQSWGTGAIASWDWTFGDGTVDSVAAPGHLYQDAGRYPVRLHVVDVDGCEDSLRKENYIYASQPEADFLVNPPVNCPGYEHYFVSLADGDGLEYQWNFGDGTSSILANTAHVYPDTGYYDVSLTVRDVNGCTASAYDLHGVQVQEIYANFWADTTQAACPPLEVHFGSDTGFNHEGLEYRWDFGNGATSNQPFPTHIYTQPGIYTVTLVLITPNGCSDTMQIENLVQIEGPTADFSFGPGEACPGELISFTAASSDTVDYEWVFGDGLSGQGQSVGHIYQDPGTYVPILVIEDDRGCRVYNSAPDTLVVHTPPEADFGVDDPLHCDQGMVQFADQSVSPEGIASWQWTTGTGDSLSGAAPTYLYTSPGTYTVGLTVTSPFGCVDHYEMADAITVVPSPRPEIQVADSTGCAPLTLHASGWVPGHQGAITAWAWSLPGQDSLFGSQALYVVHQPGQAALSLTVTDVFGCTGTAIQPFEVYAIPEPDFVASDSFGCAPFPLGFTDLSEGQITRWFWDFGNGETSEEAQPAYTYPTDGTYSVSLRVWDTHQCTGVHIKPDYIHLAHPVASFLAADSLLCPGEPVQLIDASQSDTLLVDWRWTFGDGHTEAGAPEASHAYQADGFYSPSLVVTDVFGCSDSSSRPAYVEVLSDEEPPATDITYLTVLNVGEVELHFEPYASSRNDFGAYRIFRSTDGGSQFSFVASETDRTHTHYVDAGLDTEGSRYWYKVVAENHCGRLGDEAAARVHSPINTSAEGLVEAVRVHWTPYEGWDGVDGYRIFRVNDYNPAQKTLLDIVPGTETEYLDTDMFCYDAYSYRIEAIGLRYVSYSDTAFAVPEHLKPEETSDVLQVTVVDDEDVQIDWAAAPIEQAVEVVLERDAGMGYQEVWRQPFRQPSAKFRDTSTHVHGASYRYRVFTVDTCGDFTPQGQTGNNILLRAEQEGGAVRLAWTPYEGWEKGVSHYDIELYNEQSGQYEQVARLPSTQTAYESGSSNLPQPLHCYRVMAYEHDGYEKASLSNEACVTPQPLIYTANAFTPNGDGFNDVFTLGGSFLADFEMSIYNRWGLKVFTSRSLDHPWAGLDAAGVALPEGVYVFHARGTGLNGESIRRVGSVTLLR